jgi:hypothetical protein
MAIPVKFDAEFIERRMREHRAMQQLVLELMADEVLNDIKAELARIRHARRLGPPHFHSRGAVKRLSGKTD